MNQIGTNCFDLGLGREAETFERGNFNPIFEITVLGRAYYPARTVVRPISSTELCIPYKFFSKDIFTQINLFVDLEPVVQL